MPAAADARNEWRKHHISSLPFKKLRGKVIKGQRKNMTLSLTGKAINMKADLQNAVCFECDICNVGN